MFSISRFIREHFLELKSIQKINKKANIFFLFSGVALPYTHDVYVLIGTRVEHPLPLKTNV